MANVKDTGSRGATAKARSGAEAKRSKSEHARPRAQRARGVQLARLYTKPGKDPLDEVTYERRSSIITNPDGSIVFKLEGAEIPAGWSQLATDIVISKYFRKAGLHGDKKQGERSVRQVVHRLAHTIRRAGEELGGYFANKSDADTFEAELSFLLVNQYGAFNSPVWFNCGLWHEYGITGSGGNWAWDTKSDPRGNAVVETANAYERPQCSACFIQAVSDDLMSIYDLIKAEARLFKYGSGTGSNFSAIRGKQEKLSGGGTSSGLMSFLEVFDRAAGATKSGGTTRRAAKMVCLDMDHPEIVDFITWKVREEKKAQALIAAGYPSDFNGEAYHTVSGQNSNNSVRVTDEFMRAVEAGGKWQTRMRTTGEVVDTLDAKDLWHKVAEAAWSCADPGVQYDTTINKWHTCPNSGKINASNPCSEYMFLDDTACNLSSVNLTKFLRDDGAQAPEAGEDPSRPTGQWFDIEGYRHACRVFFIAQEILVDLSSYPTKTIAQNSHDYRPLGLGYANLGSLLMQMGVPYDSDKGRAIAAALTAIMCAQGYKASADMAASKGPFNGFAKNREPMLRVMNMHRDAAYQIHRELCPTDLYKAACEDWDAAVRAGELHGYRNAQATVLAPTGTIGLLMDCDTTGVEPDFALVKFKKLAGGGYFKIVNQSVPRALSRLGYSANEIQEIVAYVSGTNTLLAAPHINRRTLKEKGLTDADLAKAEAALPSVFELDFAFGSWVIGEDTYERLGISKETRSKPGFSFLRHIGFTEEQIEEAAETIVGRMTIEGAPYLKPEHYPIFDCANRCGKLGQRFLAPMAHVKMMAAVQPFLSGAISKTVNLPNDATVEEVQRIYEEGWRLGLKAVALYRDGCKASQPLSTTSKEKKEEAANAKKETRATIPPAHKGSGVGAPLTHETEAQLSETVASASPGLSPIPKTSAPQDPQQLTLQITPAGSRPKGLRVRLPRKRVGFTQEARVGGHKIFLRTGQYEDGTLGEIFVDLHKEGAAFRSLMNCFAMSVSIGLQHGVPLETYVDQFTFTRFEPQGVVEGHPYVKLATSIVDYLFRVLGVEYLHRYDLAHVKPEGDYIPTAAFLEHPNARSERPSAPASYREGEIQQTLTMPSTQRMDDSPNSLSHTKEATARSAAMSEGLEQSKFSAQDERKDLGTGGSALSAQLEEMMGDAPVCDVCGHITVRNGACYKCLNCGNSMGCS
jgi:ribonucleoside-diphosphate reductase alpha chain